MMNDMDHSPRRAANGRFLPGQSGNPAGKRPGTRNRATILNEMLNAEEAETIARRVIDKALAGNSMAARFILGRLLAPPRDRPVELDLPEGGSAADILAAANATVQAMAAGEITPEEALTVTRVLDFRLKAVKAAARARRSTTRRTKPSPCGPFDKRSGGQGEGAWAGLSASSVPATNSPHPNPLPEGEGILRINGRARFTHDLLHSTCISRPRWASLTGVPLAA